MDSQPHSLPRSLRGRVLDLLQSRRGIWVVAALAVALAAPSLGLGLTSDDHTHLFNVRRGYDALTLFTIRGAEVANARENGILAWWSSPELSVHFFRPLSSFTHILEFRAWPDAPWLMHLWNVSIYALTAALAFLLYREFLPAQMLIAALASVMFAIDDAHAPSVGWISGRNTLLAGLFALAALLAHVRARRNETGRVPWIVASTLCTGLALGSAEAGVATFAYLIAYALVFERGSWLSRATTLAPHLAVFAVWAVLYFAGHHGAHHASYYRELTSPLALADGALDLPTWLVGLLGPSIVGMTIMLPPAIVRAIMLVVCVPLVAAVWRALPRTRENAFFVLGALLCLPPLFTTLPQDRLLIAASFGTFGAIASFLVVAKTHASRFVRGMRWAFIAFHLVLAPVFFLATLDQTRPIDNGAQALLDAIPAHSPPEVVLLNSPIELLGMYAHVRLREDASRTAPATLRQLFSGGSPLTVERTDDNTLELTALEGWGRVPVERIFGSVEDMPRPGSTVVLGSMRVSVVESTKDGRPKRVRFHFDLPLDSPERLWLAWEGRKPVVWRVPPRGEKIALEQLFLLKSLAP